MTRREKPRPSQRADLLLVDRGLAPTREKAQALILAGRVRAAGCRVDKAGARLASDALLEVEPGPRFVGRGGEKLWGALEALRLDVTGLAVLDVGASTGGFTDALLKRGAARVIALDVGRGQLDWSLRKDPRVVPVEGVNVRYLAPDDLPGPFPLVVVDVSFISLRLVLPPLGPLLGRGPVAPAGPPEGGAAPLPAILALVKPQFEVGPARVGKGGIVRDASAQLDAVLDIARFAASPEPAALLEPSDATASRALLGTVPLGLWRIVESPLRGAEGNREFFVHLVPGYDRSWREIEEEARTIVSGPDGAGR